MRQKPLFDRPSVLSWEQIDFYHANGFVAVNLLSSRECDAAVEVFDEYRKLIGDLEYKGIMNLDRPDYCLEHYGVREDWIHMYVKQMLIKHPSVVTGLEILQGRNVGCVANVQSMFLFKKAGSPQAWNPHQDNIYPRAKHGAYITANLVFTDQDKENGCMFIYPGSHKEKLLKVRKMKSFHEEKGQKPGHDVSNDPIFETKYAGREVDIPMKKGDVLFLHGNCIHGSYPNNSKDRDRPMLLIPYLTNGYKFRPGKVGKRTELPIR